MAAEGQGSDGPWGSSVGVDDRLPAGPGSPPSGFVAVADVSELERTGMHRVVLEGEGEEILLIQGRRAVFAVANRCPHLSRELHLGKLLGPSTFECPGHGWRFDLTSGNVARRWWDLRGRAGSGPRLRMHPVIVEGTTILVRRDR